MERTKSRKTETETKTRKPAASEISERIKAFCVQFDISKQDLHRKLMEAGMAYDPAHQLATRIFAGRQGMPSLKTSSYLEKALGIPKLRDLIMPSYKEATARLVTAGMVSTPFRTRSEIIKDLESILEDDTMAPYLAMAATILSQLA